MLVTRLFIIIALFLFGQGLANAAVAEDADKEPGFLTLLQDVPLMPGLKEHVSESVAFDKPSGRIVESTAYGHARSAEDILYFYRRTLPQLGWSLESDHSFVRKDEHLRITVAQAGNTNKVIFHITPR